MREKQDGLLARALQDTEDADAAERIARNGEDGCSIPRPRFERSIINQRSSKTTVSTSRPLAKESRSVDSADVIHLGDDDDDNVDWEDGENEVPPSASRAISKETQSTGCVLYPLYAGNDLCCTQKSWCRLTLRRWMMSSDAIVMQ